MQPKPKIRFYTERDSFGVEAAVILLSLSIIFRLIGTWGLWADRTFLITQIALPVASALLFILLILLLGRVALWSTSLPVLLGAAFFVLKAFGFESTVHTVLCVLLYVLVAVLWCGTVFNLIRTKWLLPPLFLLPFLYHVGVEDLKALQNTAEPVTFAAGMQEMSVLCIMLALFFASLAMKKRYKDPQPELPKIKDPVVVPPEKPEPAEPPAPETPPQAEAPVPETPEEPRPVPQLSLDPDASQEDPSDTI